MNGAAAPAAEEKRPWTQKGAFAKLRRRSAAADVGLSTIEGYQRHRSGQNAALLSFYGFLSVFPLTIAATTILGFVLHSRPDLRDDIVDSALKNLPIIGQQISTDPSRIDGNVAALVLSLLTTLWAATRACVGMQGALDDVAEVPLDERPNGAVKRLRAMLGIVIVGTAQVGAVIVTSIVGVGHIAWISRVLLFLAAAAINVVTILAVYRWLCSRCTTWRGALPGAVGAGIVFAGLQLVGTAVVGRAIAKASPVYGTFATVIALCSWLSLHATVSLLGAEVNQVLGHRSAQGRGATA
jgi:YihY family inner membrane protein